MIPVRYRPVGHNAPTPGRDRGLALAVVVVVGLIYSAWLGWHWLALDYSDKEFGGFVSRLWDVRRELVEHHSLPWWTPYYLSGSSYGLHHSQALYLVPALLYSAFFDLLTSVKLTALTAIFASAVAMYFCARHFLASEWAAALAALAFLLHPEQVLRAVGAEHLGITLFVPFVPLSWLFLARSLESRRFSDVFWCSLAVAASVWAHNKMALVNLLFLAGYVAYWVRFGKRANSDADGWRVRLRVAVRSCALLGVLALSLGAFFLVPGLTETRYAKLFEGDPIRAWQETYAFKSLFALVDRDGALTRDAIANVLQAVNARGGARSQEEYERATRIVAMQTDSPEKYSGLVLLGLLAAAALVNRRRENRPLFWFLVAAFLASVVLAYGRSTVWGANTTTWSALFAVDGVPARMKFAFFLGAAGLLAFCLLFYRRKLGTGPRRALAGSVLLAFLLVPAFALVASLPLFAEIRAPYVFYDITAAFLLALLAGFFVTDVVASRAPIVVAGIAVLLLCDYWPYQRAASDNLIEPRTLANMRAAYASIRADADLVKVYMLSGRMVRLLAPMMSGKPLAYEDFYSWMAPKGSGYLNTQARGEPALFDLLGARYVIFDKSDPRMADAAPVLQRYRMLYDVHHEDEDFVVFRNPGAHAYLSAYRNAARFEGDPRESVALSLALSQRHWPLIYAEPRVGDLVERVYRAGETGPLPDVGQPVALGIESMTRPSPGTVHAVLNVEQPCWLVIAESYYPFWRATLGMQSIPVYQASVGLMAVRLPAGRQQLSLEYSLPAWYLGAQLVSAAALLIAMLACWRERRRAPLAVVGP